MRGLRLALVAAFLAAACGPVPLVCDRADLGASVTATSDSTGRPETFRCVQTTAGGYAWVMVSGRPQ